MRGHEDLIRLRESGVKPTGMVYVDDYKVMDKWVKWLSEKTMVTICTHGDDVQSLDMRFLVGMAVNVSGDDIDRVKALSVACKRAGASVVFAHCCGKSAMWKSGEAAWQTF